MDRLFMHDLRKKVDERFVGFKWYYVKKKYKLNWNFFCLCS